MYFYGDDPDVIRHSKPPKAAEPLQAYLEYFIPMFALRHIGISGAKIPKLSSASILNPLPQTKRRQSAAFQSMQGLAAWSG